MKESYRKGVANHPGPETPQGVVITPRTQKITWVRQPTLSALADAKLQNMIVHWPALPKLVARARGLRVSACLVDRSNKTYLPDLVHTGDLVGQIVNLRPIGNRPPGPWVGHRRAAIANRRAGCHPHNTGNRRICFAETTY